MDRIDFGGGKDVEASLFEAQRKTAGTREEVDRDGPAMLDLVNPQGTHRAFRPVFPAASVGTATPS